MKTPKLQKGWYQVPARLHPLEDDGGMSKLASAFFQVANIRMAYTSDSDEPGAWKKMMETTISTGTLKSPFFLGLETRKADHNRFFLIIHDYGCDIAFTLLETVEVG